MFKNKPRRGSCASDATLYGELVFLGLMRLLFVTHYFYPEAGAPQTRILEAALILRSHGHEVTILTGMPNYPDGIIPESYRGRLLIRQRLAGMKVVRSAVYPAPNRGFTRRLMNHASSAISAVIASPAVGPVDVVIGETPPLFTAIASVAIASARRAPACAERCRPVAGIGGATRHAQ